ncbi:Ras-related protein Rab-24 [Tritrichomonas foetus]|uniref:Ras-related protein Rab-24 n=1 Tax=Tritrichomonas foetus TaxID=1144522 RepID=A0A1J4JQ83_9EUKA|nr:Ras-related protein Rab-24 [Tritrichomonas foetus]|eukprot:OHT00906.1 Ras-related protein Rab-24 [Tritrichomonas foetus]
MESDLKIKVILLGDVSVGKTCLYQRYFWDKFEFMEPSVKSDNNSKVVNRDDTEFRLEVWDTAGAEQYRSITKLHYRNSDVALLLFDMNDLNSLEGLDYWESELSMNEPKCIKYIVATKSDTLVEDEQENIMRRAKSKFYDYPKNNFFMTSARNGQGINELFDFLINDQRIPLNNHSLSSIQQSNDSNNKCC